MGTRARKTESRPPRLADEISEGLANAIRYAEGDKTAGVEHGVQVPDRVDVRRVRRKLGMSQAVFAKQFGISIATLRNWEQGRRAPEGPARVLLTIIDREPQAVSRALRVPA